MGTFYTNIHLKHGKQQDVFSVIEECGGVPAYISKPHGGWISVFPQATESQDDTVMKKVCASLSAKLNTGVIGFTCHDSDIFIYVLAENGRVVDEFNSCPGYFDGSDDAPSGGDADRLMRYCPPGTTREQIEKLLHNKNGDGGPDPTRAMSAQQQTGAKTLKKTILKMVPWFARPIVWLVLTIYFALNAKKFSQVDPNNPLPAFADMGVFAGDTMASEVAGLLGIGDEYATSGFNYIHEGDAPVGKGQVKLVGKVRAEPHSEFREATEAEIWAALETPGLEDNVNFSKLIGLCQKLMNDSLDRCQGVDIWIEPTTAGEIPRISGCIDSWVEERLEKVT